MACTITGLLTKNLLLSIEAKKCLLQSPEQQALFTTIVKAIVHCYQHGGRLYIAGNGGSAADAQHLAAEFISKLARARAPLPAEALTVDSSVLTAIGNDYGFQHIFARQIRGKMTPNDLFLGITTSGKSPNIVHALDTCREMGIQSVVFTGFDGGDVPGKADYCFIAPGTTTSTIQEVHIVLLHTLCESVESILFMHELKELESVV
jgi:D-sedoheptulose 7-phosphate isomerase